MSFGAWSDSTTILPVDLCGAFDDSEPVPQVLASSGTAKLGSEPERTLGSPVITTLAKNITRRGKVEDNLLRRQDEYNARLEILRRGREMEELLQLRGPEITAKSKGLHRTQLAHERLFKDAGRRRSHSTESREALDTTLAPQINDSSRCLTRTTNHLMEWQFIKEQKRIRSQQIKESHEMDGMQPSPSLNPMSRMIASNRAVKVEDSLLRQHNVRVAEATKAREHKLESSRQTTPRRRRGSLKAAVSPRLVEMATPTKRSLSNTEGKKCVRDPETGQELFTPKVNVATVRRQGGDVWAHLVEEGKKKEYRKQRAAEWKDMTEAKQYSGKPSLGAYTKLLAGLHKEPDRIMQGTHHVKSRMTIDSVKEEMKNESFTPYVSEASQEIDRQCKAGTVYRDRIDFLNAKQEEYERNRLSKKEQKLAEEAASTPAPPSATIKDNSVTFTKQNNWERRKEIRLTNSRREQLQAEERHCTFSPKINGPPQDAVLPTETVKANKEAWLSEIHAIRQSYASCP